MRLIAASTLAVAVALVAPGIGAIQMDVDRQVPGGGVFAPGWKGRVPDASSTKQGRVVNDSKFEMKGNTITINSGPGMLYWNPANTASGNYSVRGTFNEPKVMSASSHSHPYGLFIAGNNLDGDNISLVYCVPYATGRFIVRGFGPAATPGATPSTWFLGPNRQPIPNAAIQSAPAGGTVTQDIVMSVKDGTMTCSINGTVVATHQSSEMVGPGKLASLNGIYGIRMSHNIDVVVTNFGMTKN
jgi:hypothetical protein